MRLSLRGHTVDCTGRTAIMAILNVSDDSPVAQSRVAVPAALDRAMQFARQGAEIIDIGANSTGRDSRDLTAQEEIERVCPVIEAVAAEGVPTSVDTWNPAVAHAAAEAGVHLLNDVTGFTAPAMIDVAAEHQIPAVVMHMRGAPKHHREVDQAYDDIAPEVQAFLLERARTLAGRGIEAWLDPGFAFGKSLEDNLRLFEGLPALVSTGYPVLISASRKGFLAELLGLGDRQDVDGLTEATLAFNVLAAWAGVHVVRVHDVGPVAVALRTVNGMRQRLSGEAESPARRSPGVPPELQ
ncbi:MAG: dihydropteroate synthase [Dehalococcoidia bacterium]|nr:dihydropteroate synthase [Dehalococcoidia bacterium]